MKRQLSLSKLCKKVKNSATTTTGWRNAPLETDGSGERLPPLLTRRDIPKQGAR